MVGEACISKAFSITYQEEPTPPLENPTLKAPSFTFVEKPFKVTGETPEPNQQVWIELETILLDEKIAEGVSDANRKFEIEVQLTELGINKIHSEIDVKYLPNKTSQTRSILALNYMMAGLLLVIVLFMGYKLYQKHGKKKGGRRKK